MCRVKGKVLKNNNKGLILTKVKASVIKTVCSWHRDKLTNDTEDSPGT